MKVHERVKVYLDKHNITQKGIVKGNQNSRNNP